jgi:uncharacterized SAM-binding protein YcdF (DUF218 family)
MLLPKDFGPLQIRRAAGVESPPEDGPSFFSECAFTFGEEKRCMMKRRWPRSRTGAANNSNPGSLSDWFGELKSQAESPNAQPGKNHEEEPYVGSEPIEPQGRKLIRPSIVKWVIFLLFAAYILLSYYRAPILAGLGKYLIVEHPLKKADLIVCLMGNPVDRGLAAAELYEQGMAPRILFAREDLPDGMRVLKERGVQYPETRDLLERMLEGLGVPKSDLIASDQFAGNTFEEAKLAKEIVQREGYRSLIVVTSPTHTRRAALAFERVFGKDETDLMIRPSKYSNFSPEDWWKKRKYVKEVIIEYQKLIYYMLKYA